jgi:hypothetical protein
MARKPGFDRIKGKPLATTSVPSRFGEIGIVTDFAQIFAVTFLK